MVLDFEPYRPNKTKPYLTYSPNLPTDLTYMINPPDGQVLTYPLTYHYNLLRSGFISFRIQTYNLQDRWFTKPSGPRQMSRTDLDRPP